jgi:cold shock CspA family protein
MLFEEGTVKFFKHESGWGFAKSADGREHFLHARNFACSSHVDSVEPGARVRFVVGKSPRNGKDQALHIELVDVPESQQQKPWWHNNDR